MKLWWLLVVSSLLSPAFAQTPETGRGGGGGTGTVILSVQAGTNGVFSIKGAPFSADTIRESDRVLADGNRIHQETHGKIARDSEGRIRTESELILSNGGILRRVEIHDPVGEAIIQLNDQNKVAMVSHYRKPSSEKTSDPLPKTFLPPMMPAKKHASTSEDLGNMSIEGFNVKGTRHTNTIAAGEVGNEQPIIVTTEAWFSPELRISLLSTQDDPRQGHSTDKLVNIHAGEPDPALFQVPADYTIRDNPPQK